MSPNVEIRTRIGYTSPPLITEVFISDFYSMVPAGVRLAVTTLSVVDVSSGELDNSLSSGRRAALEMARAGVDVVMLGGMPVVMSTGGVREAHSFLKSLSAEVDVPVRASVFAQAGALDKVDAKKVAVVYAFAAQEPSDWNYLREFGFDVIGCLGAGLSTADLGSISSDVAVDLANRAVQKWPEIDTILFSCAHWPIVERIAELESALGRTIITSGQAICWDALRVAGVSDRVEGFGRLFDCG